MQKKIFDLKNHKNSPNLESKKIIFFKLTIPDPENFFKMKEECQNISINLLTSFFNVLVKKLADSSQIINNFFILEINKNSDHFLLLSK